MMRSVGRCREVQQRGSPSGKWLGSTALLRATGRRLVATMTTHQGSPPFPLLSRYQQTSVGKNTNCPSVSCRRFFTTPDNRESPPTGSGAHERPQQSEEVIRTTYQYRTTFRTEPTTNPNCQKVYYSINGVNVLDTPLLAAAAAGITTTGTAESETTGYQPRATLEIPTKMVAIGHSPLALHLLVHVPSLTTVFFGDGCITLRQQEEADNSRRSGEPRWEDEDGSLVKAVLREMEMFFFGHNRTVLEQRHHQPQQEDRQQRAGTELNPPPGGAAAAAEEDDPTSNPPISRLLKSYSPQQQTPTGEICTSIVASETKPWSHRLVAGTQQQQGSSAPGAAAEAAAVDQSDVSSSSSSLCDGRVFTPAAMSLMLSYGDADTAILETDDEPVQAVKEMIGTIIRPVLQQDGGNIRYVGMELDGTVYVMLEGACRTCPSSQVTLREFVERNLSHYVPEVFTVVLVDESFARQFWAENRLDTTWGVDGAPWAAGVGSLGGLAQNYEDSEDHHHEKDHDNDDPLRQMKDEYLTSSAVAHLAELALLHKRGPNSVRFSSAAKRRGSPPPSSSSSPSTDTGKKQ